MTETDTYYYTLKIRDELIAQNKKLDKIAQQLEAQTKLQEGIFKQLYLLCQMMGKSLEGRYELARESEEAFMDTGLSKDTIEGE